MHKSKITVGRKLWQKVVSESDHLCCSNKHTNIVYIVPYGQSLKSTIRAPLQTSCHQYILFTSRIQPGPEDNYDDPGSMYPPPLPIGGNIFTLVFLWNVLIVIPSSFERAYCDPVFFGTCLLWSRVLWNVLIVIPSSFGRAYWDPVFFRTCLLWSRLSQSATSVTERAYCDPGFFGMCLLWCRLSQTVTRVTESSV